MRVYRIERPESHQGPYVGQDKDPDIMAAFELAGQDCNGNGNRRPGPWGDFGKDFFKYFTAPEEAVRFGFPSKGHALDWFGPLLLQLLYSIGFAMVEYDVPAGEYEISNSGKQVVFVHPRLKDQ